MDFKATISILRSIHYMMLGPFMVDPQAIIPEGDAENRSTRTGRTAAST